MEWASNAIARGKFRLGYESQSVPRCCMTERQFDPCLKETRENESGHLKYISCPDYRHEIESSLHNSRADA